MAKRKSRSKKSVSSLPKGLPVRGGGRGADGAILIGNNNPFEVAQRTMNKRPKFAVHNNRGNDVGSMLTNQQQQQQQRPSALAEALQQRKSAITAALKQQKKVNVFSDKRIYGENDRTAVHNNSDERNLARLVRERARQSKRSARFALRDNDSDEEQVERTTTLTHRGKAIDSLTAVDHVMLSDDEEGAGDLDAFDTEMHFGGSISLADRKEASIYGSKAGGTADMATAYSQKKSDLDDLILRRKILKAERLKSKEEQVDKFEAMDQSFSELAALLNFRDKEKDIRIDIQAKRAGIALAPEDQEFADWDREMKQYLHADRKVAATDRTRTPEEIAREEADRLHALETRRLARMNGDFDGNDGLSLSDVDSSDDDDTNGKGGNNNKKKKRPRYNKQPKRRTDDYPEALDNDSDAEEEEEDEEEKDPNHHLTARFTADGLVYVDKNGLVVGKEVGEHEAPTETSAVAAAGPDVVYKVGDKVTASYRATEQYDGFESWFAGTIVAVHNNKKDGSIRYDVEYDDGDFEEGVQAQHIRQVEKTAKEMQAENRRKDQEVELKRKRQKAKEKARAEIPYVFEVPKTLTALHDMIGNYATTGKDASLIIQRIHKANSVRLDRRNAEKMQNFYDVLIRRFVAVGDAIYKSGDGGVELGRYGQLDALTQTLYAMAQESAEHAGAVWSRRLGFFQSAHAKRLRDAALEREVDDDCSDEEDFTAWPSTGVVLALRALGHIFPATDKRHPVMSPATLFLGQVVSHTPILSVHDLVVGIVCCGLLIEYTREAKRVAPEAHAFLASVIRLFAARNNTGASQQQRQRESHPQLLPTLSAASTLEALSTLRSQVSNCDLGELAPQLSLEAETIRGSNTPAAILYAALHLVEFSVKNLSGSLSSAEKEAFAEITDSILALQPKTKKSDALPNLIQTKVSSVASALSSCCQLERARAPLQRRAGLSVRDAAVQSLAPRLENPDRYGSAAASSSRQNGDSKTAMQAAADRSRREYKREHKAVARELRLDGAVIESERRREQEKRDSAARAKRQKAFAWLEGEQAVMNQQVRQGGGLLQGGGMGAAKAKAASGKFGIKKGGKLR